ncbi:polyketide biosynthesis methyltransferase [Leucobacter viscericola]|uniref:Polyketide biosynthesis methyltransferase n=1 Tax=Leucobacter viscericola TaxID=2714935 RepID=A0A6G7XDP9_9MICO|nr:methyltransferase dimerization domain-containing protein [Leucobacter viscericola]QIK62596.1 polyketide biosynthesis methyltransferase [Leucobacter viscericola]
MAATPERIVDIAIGFMGAKQLDAAARIGLFKALADGPQTAAQIASATQRAERQVRTLADAMNSFGLLERVDGKYSLAEDAATYLGGAGEVDLTPFIGFLGDISFKQWLGYDHTVDTDNAGVLDLDEDGWGDFMNGVMTYNALHAEQFGRAFDFSGYRSALDFGGLAAGFSLAAMAQNPELHTRFVYAADMAGSIAADAEQAGFAHRTTIETADTETAEPGGEHDLVLLTHVLHRFDEVQNRQILQAAREAAAPGATLMLLDFFLDNDPAQRRIDALHAGEYFNIDGTVVYPVDQVEGWLEATGWQVERMVALPGSPRVLVATAVSAG